MLLSSFWYSAATSWRRFVHCGEVRQLHRQDRRLHSVEPAVDALDLMVALHEAAVPREHAHAIGKLLVVGDDGAGVAHRAEILSGIEAE